jgi:hypothetical protein
MGSLGCPQQKAADLGTGLVARQHCSLDLFGKQIFVGVSVVKFWFICIRVDQLGVISGNYSKRLGLFMSRVPEFKTIHNNVQFLIERSTVRQHWTAESKFSLFDSVHIQWNRHLMYIRDKQWRGCVWKLKLEVGIANFECIWYPK